MLLVMEVATLKIILFCITQTVLIGVAFQGTCKTVLEAIIFVFVMHPFDIGDRCVIDGVHVINSFHNLSFLISFSLFHFILNFNSVCLHSPTDDRGRDEYLDNSVSSI